MAKERSRVADYAIYLISRIGASVLQSLPIDWACAFIDWITFLLFHVDRLHREICIDNVRRALPGQFRDDELHAMALDVYRHFGMCLLETLLMQRKLTAANVHESIDMREYPKLDAVLHSGRPVIVLTAHYGNWELAAHWLGLVGVHSHLVARPLDNPYLDDWLRSLRERTGHRMLAKKGDTRRMTELLDAGGTLCTLGDQDAGSRGLYVDFFGQPASTHKAIARLAQRSGAIIAVVGMQRTGGLFEFTFRIMDLIEATEYDEHPDAIFAITQRFTTAIEQMIRVDPSQYFWFHRRWKHQPRAVSALSLAG